MKDAVQKQLIATRRDQILDGAAKVFAEKGFHPTTIKDIARAVGIADGTIYNYFENKTALLLGIFDRMRDSVQPDVSELNLSEMDMRAFMTAYFRYPLMALKGENFALFRVVVSEMMVNNELRTLYFQRILEPALLGGEQLLQHWAERQAIRSIDIRLTTRALSGIILGLILENIMGDTTLEAQWEALPAFLADLFLDGIGGDRT
ncbi:MAG: TetR/AcrR family transcriptional regulator [Chloroflexota bacterium]|nr:TetR/AcrR family transcriptional regulator [Chloroflexota bacterium]